MSDMSWGAVAATSTPADAGSNTDPNIERVANDAVDPNAAPDAGADQDGVLNAADDAADGEPAEKITFVINGKPRDFTMDQVKEAAQRYFGNAPKFEQLKRERAEIKSAHADILRKQQGVKAILEIVAKGDIETIADFAAKKLNAKTAFEQGIQKFVMKQIAIAKMSPEAREAMEAKQKLEEMRQHEAERAKHEALRAFEYRVNQFQQHVLGELPKALKQVGLPDTEFYRDQTLTVMREAIDRGQNPTMAAAANYVKRRLAEAKLFQAGQPQSVQKPVMRKRATLESTGIAGRKPDDGQYKSFEELVAARRGRG